MAISVYRIKDRTKVEGRGGRGSWVVGHGGRGGFRTTHYHDYRIRKMNDDDENMNWRARTVRNLDK